MKRVGMVIGTVPEKLGLYKKLHSDENAGVRHLLKRYHFQNFNIFITRMEDGEDYLFGYYEYTGEDFEKDDAELRALPEYAEWLKVTGSCQRPLSGEKEWKAMEKVFFLE
jgi:L-rhamnose mutarotase